MPFVHVELVEGRSDEQLKGMMCCVVFRGMGLMSKMS